MLCWVYNFLTLFVSDQGLTWTMSLASGKLSFSQIFLDLNQDLDIVHYGKYNRAVFNVNVFYSCP